MTTMIHEEDRPTLPKPSAYSRHADYVLARQEAERQWREGRTKDRRRRALLVLCLALAVAALLWLS